jgi:hypothetical protein
MLPERRTGATLGDMQLRSDLLNAGTATRQGLDVSPVVVVSAGSVGQAFVEGLESLPAPSGDRAHEFAPTCSCEWASAIYRRSASLLVPPRPVRATTAALRIESFAAKISCGISWHATASAKDDPPLVLMDDAVMALAHGQELATASNTSGDCSL